MSLANLRPPPWTQNAACRIATKQCAEQCARNPKAIIRWSV